jgi:hypothetical protein
MRKQRSHRASLSRECEVADRKENKKLLAHTSAIMAREQLVRETAEYSLSAYVL